MASRTSPETATFGGRPPQSPQPPGRSRRRAGRRPLVVGVLAAGIAAGVAGGVWAGMRISTSGSGSDSAGLATTAVAHIIRTDLSTTQEVDGRLGFAATYHVANQVGTGTVTSLPAPGQVISRGQTLYEVDGRPVTLLYGVRPQWRTLTSGISAGPDVTQLEQNLLALGFATPSTLTADGVFTSSDAAAVKRWQAARGLLQTGGVSTGDAVYEPGPLRVTVVNARLGAPVQPGMEILSATSTQRVVNVALPVSDAALVHQGDAVTVHLPDGATSATGRVDTIASVATVPQDASGSQGGPPPQATIAVTVVLSDPAVTGSLDEAPVTVSITDRSVHGVLAVPVNALVAPSNGGYAVEIVDHGQHRLLAVQPGLFATTFVEVSGQGLAEGMSVVVPTQ